MRLVSLSLATSGPAGGAASAACAAAARSTSDLVIRPAAPVPVTAADPRRDDGPACAQPATPRAACRHRGAPEPPWAAPARPAGESPQRRCVRVLPLAGPVRPASGRPLAGTSWPPAQHRWTGAPARCRRALPFRPGRRSRRRAVFEHLDLDRGLCGVDLGDDLAAVDLVAGLHVPLEQGALLHVRAEGGHAEVTH